MSRDSRFRTKPPGENRPREAGFQGRDSLVVSWVMTRSKSPPAGYRLCHTIKLVDGSSVRLYTRQEDDLIIFVTKNGNFRAQFSRNAGGTMAPFLVVSESTALDQPRLVAINLVARRVKNIVEEETEGPVEVELTTLWPAQLLVRKVDKWHITIIVLPVCYVRDGWVDAYAVTCNVQPVNKVVDHARVQVKFDPAGEYNGFRRAPKSKPTSTRR